jgi:hypothetical protein
MEFNQWYNELPIQKRREFLREFLQVSGMSKGYFYNWKSKAGGAFLFIATAIKQKYDKD